MLSLPSDKLRRRPVMPVLRLSELLPLLIKQLFIPRCSQKFTSFHNDLTFFWKRLWIRVRYIIFRSKLDF